MWTSLQVCLALLAERHLLAPGCAGLENLPGRIAPEPWRNAWTAGIIVTLEGALHGHKQLCLVLHRSLVNPFQKM